MLNGGDRSIGLTGQSMGGPKNPPKRAFAWTRNTAGTYTPPRVPWPAMVDAYLIGGGGGWVTGSNRGGGGAEAMFHRFQYLPGQVPQCIVGAGGLGSGGEGQDGGITQITLDGVVITSAKPGSGGGSSGGGSDFGGRGGIGMSPRRGGNIGSVNSGLYGFAGTGSTSNGSGGPGGFLDMFSASDANNELVNGLYGVGSPSTSGSGGFALLVFREI